MDDPVDVLTEHGDVEHQLWRPVAQGAVQPGLESCQVLAITGDAELLDRYPILQRTLAIRDTYLDPISYLQVALLKRSRKSGETSPELQRALLLTVFALVVLVGSAVLMGSVWLILTTNVGSRVGTLNAVAGFFGWMAIMGFVWWIYGIGMVGEAPSWQVVEVNEVLADAPETINQDAYEEGLKRHRETEKFADEYERERLKEEEERARIEQETIKPVAPATGGTAVAPYRNRPVQKKPDLPLDNVGGRPVTLPAKIQ